MLPLDCHTHIQPGIASSQLKKLDACLVAVTRSISEYTQVAMRKDSNTIWAVGVHPGLLEAHKHFSRKMFQKLLKTALIVGEVGLDTKVMVDIDIQRYTLDDIFSCLMEYPRITSVHTRGAAGMALDLLEKHDPVGIVLHWWQGNKKETYRALELGCFFSLNPAGITNPLMLDWLPRDRILTETDHPFGDKKQSPPRQPGRMSTIERALAENWGTDIKGVRRQVWANFCHLATETSTAELFPPMFQTYMLAA